MYNFFDKNETGNDYVVGDIHGCYTKLEDKLKEIGFDENNDRLFSVGDLIDRGEENHRVFEFLEKPWFHAVKGNHEDMIIEYFYTTKENKEISKPSMIKNGSEWFVNLKLEEQHEYVKAFEQLSLYFDIVIKDNKRVGIVHADCYHNDWNLNIKELLEPVTFNKIYDNAIWNRKRITFKDTSYIKNIDYVIHGHTPLLEPAILGNRFYIDTGAVFNNNLTILNLNDLISFKPKTL